MTYGERAVGLTFNPSGDPRVQKIKELYAEIIDLCYDENSKDDSGERGRLLAIAVEFAQTAQMWAVKAITWQDE